MKKSVVPGTVAASKTVSTTLTAPHISQLMKLAPQNFTDDDDDDTV